MFLVNPPIIAIMLALVPRLPAGKRSGGGGIDVRGALLVTTGIAALIGAILAGYVYFASLYLQKVLGFSPVETDLALVPSTITVVLISTLGTHRRGQLPRRGAARPDPGRGLGRARNAHRVEPGHQQAGTGGFTRSGTARPR